MVGTAQGRLLTTLLGQFQTASFADAISRSRRMFARALPGSFGPRRREGAGNAGCPMHPQPRVRFVVLVCTRVFTAEAPDTSGIPHAMVLRLIRALPGDRALLPPSFAGKSRDLDASVGAPGPHAFAVRIGALVSRRQSVHRI